MFLLLQFDRKHVQLFTMHDLVHDLARLVMGEELLDAHEKFKSGGSNCRYAFLPDSSKPLKSYVNYPDKIRALRFLGRGGTGQCSIGVSTAKYLSLGFRRMLLKEVAIFYWSTQTVEVSLCTRDQRSSDSQFYHRALKINLPQPS
jgi:hypothetical protein